MSLKDIGAKILAERIKRHPIELLKSLGLQVNWHLEVLLDAMMEHQYLLFMMPRGAGKTKAGSEVFPAWKIGTNPQEESFAIYSYNDSYARSILRGAVGIMETHPPYKEAFGNLKPAIPDKWSNSQIIVEGKTEKKTPSIEVIGIESGNVGRHPGHIILDDPISMDIVRSPKKLRRVLAWYQSVLMPQLDPESRLTVIMTPWSVNDLSSVIKADKRFKTIIVEALGSKGTFAKRHLGKSYWPERFPLEFLLQKKAGDAYTWATQYMCDPSISSADYPLKKDWRTYWTVGESQLDKKIFKLPQKADMKFIQAVDPNIMETSESNYFVDLTIGRDKYGTLYVVDYVREQLDPTKHVDTIVSQYRAWKPYKIILESNAGQKLLEPQLRPYHLPLYPRPSVGKKEDRIAINLSPPFKNGTLRISLEHRELIKEYDDFPWGETDDILDALEMIVSDLRDTRTYDWGNITEFGDFRPIKVI